MCHLPVSNRTVWRSGEPSLPTMPRRTAAPSRKTEQLRQLKHLNPADERVSPDAWEEWRQRWDVRMARGAWEGLHEGTHVPYPEALLTEK
jgi:hypothetical protein